MTCVFDPELLSMLLECVYLFMQVGAVRPQHTRASFHSASRLPEHSLRRVLHRQWLLQQCSDFNHRGFHCIDCAVLTEPCVSDPTLPCPTCEALTCSIGDLLLNGSLSGPDCASWIMGESSAVTCAEEYQAVNETSGTLTCAYDEVVGDVVLEVAVPKCLPVVCSLDDPSKGVRHERRDILSQGSCRTTCTECYEADGSISTTSLRWLSPGEFVSDAQTVYPSCSQMPCSDTLTHSGVGVNSSCGGASIGDTCMVFCAEGYQAVSNETSTLTCACRPM